MDSRITRLTARLAASLVAFVALALVAGPIHAASPSPAASGPTTWGVQPSGPDGPDGRPAFEYSVAPGESLIDYVGVSNFGEAPLTVHLYATDAFNTDDGGFALLTADETPTDVGSWVRLAEDTHVIPPMKRLDIPFQIQVPTDAEPGDHIGGIVAALEVAATDDAGNGVVVERRVGSRIYLTVEGAVKPGLTIDAIGATYDSGWDPVSGTLTVTYTVRNTGNVRLAARQAVTATGPFGLALKGLDLDDLPELLPGATVTATTTFTEIAPVGRITATVRLDPYTTGRDQTVRAAPVEATTETWALPVLLAGLLLLAVEAIVALIWWRRRQRRHARSERERAIEAARAEGMALARQEAAATPPRAPGDEP